MKNIITRAMSALIFGLAGMLACGQSSAALLGFTVVQPPSIFTSNTSTLTYTAADRLMSAGLIPSFIRLASGTEYTVYPTQDAASQRYVRLRVHISADGNSATGDPTGNDLEFVGAVDLNSNGAVDPGESGVLLTGEVLSFGHFDSGTANDRFEMRFQVTGGYLASEYAGRDLGLIMSPESSGFTGSFDTNFSATFVKSVIGGLNTLCVNLEKQISVDGGVTWANADNESDPDVPVVSVPHDAEYRLVVQNCGSADLVNLQVTDPTLNVDVTLANLAAGATQTVTKVEASALQVPGRCDHAGTLINSSRVDADAATTLETVSDSDDAVVKCTTTPQIDIKKQISVDGGASWMDADTAATAPVVTAPHGADYRFIVTNTGTADLTGVTINDAALGITDYPVGDLAMGASVTIGSGSIPAASVAQRCANPGEFTNTASTSGQSVDDGSTVNDSDVAVLVCAGEPGIEVVKEISVDGGVTWADANTSGSADTPSVPFPHGAEYRFIVRNVGKTDLVNVAVDDPDLGVSYTIPGVLAVGAEVVVGSGDVGGALTLATRCDSSGSLTNVVNVTGQSSETGQSVTASDPAVINCYGTPGIKLRKQISLNGTDWADADAAGAGDTPTAEAPADAYYRFLVSNVGNVDLTDVVLGDATIGITHTIGNLAVGENVVIDSGVIPSGLLVTDRCTTAGDFVNVADVSGAAADTGAVVSDTDPAVLTCTVPPPSECGCEGKVTHLTLKYLGDSMAHVKVKQSKDGAIVYDSIVMPGDTFSFSGTWNFGTLGTEIKIYVDGVYQVAIHTSCSKPIGPGLIAGDFEVIDGASRHFPQLCPVEDQPPPDCDKPKHDRCDHDKGDHCDKPKHDRCDHDKPKHDRCDKDGGHDKGDRCKDKGKGHDRGDHSRCDKDKGHHGKDGGSDCKRKGKGHDRGDHRQCDRDKDHGDKGHGGKDGGSDCKRKGKGHDRGDHRQCDRDKDHGGKDSGGECKKKGKGHDRGDHSQCDRDSGHGDKGRDGKSGGKDSGGECKKKGKGHDRGDHSQCDRDSGHGGKDRYSKSGGKSYGGSR